GSGGFGEGGADRVGGLPQRGQIRGAGGGDLRGQPGSDHHRLPLDQTGQHIDRHRRIPGDRVGGHPVGGAQQRNPGGLRVVVGFGGQDPRVQVRGHRVEVTLDQPRRPSYARGTGG